MRQRGFCDSTLKPLMDKAEDGREVLLFLDASHFVMGCDYLGFIYGKVRRFVKSFSGRMRYNVLGADAKQRRHVLNIFYFSDNFSLFAG